MIKINLGCGPLGKDDWINLDWGILAFLHKNHFLEKMLLNLGLFPKGYDVKWPGNLRFHDCRKKLPFRSDSVDYIYTSHFLEHLKKFEAQQLLGECLRVLKKNGVLRIAVPDLELILRKYLEKDKSFFIKSLGLDESKNIPLADILMGMFYPKSFQYKFAGLTKIKAFFVRAHLWMYDCESLANLLRKSGFEIIEKMSFRKGRVPDLDILDIFPEISLYIEAIK
jgi:predicted SAM-dependent methyltransferase